MKIKKVEIEAFRAYQSKSDGTFDFTNEGDIPSNFVAIYAPNGFGKSSFYDAVEWAITNHLERLGGEYNKSNNQSAAKSTKDPTEGQKILRNKYVDEKVITKVVVSTTRPTIFERKLPKIRKNQRDMRIGDYSQRENEFFRRVILSQDEIDRFLREAKPQERYAKFMDSFGSEIEIARKELSALISDNKAELDILNKARTLLIDELDQPIDLSVFEHFNSVAAELNAMGESIALPDECFSSQSEHGLNASLVLRQHELNTSLQANTRTEEELADRLAKIPEIELHLRDLAEQGPLLTKLLKGVADADRYQELIDSHEKCVSDQRQVHARLTRLIEVAENAESFLQTESRLHELATKQKYLTEERSKSSTKLADLELKLSELNTELKAADDRTLLLRNSVDNAGAVYMEISTQRVRIGVIGKEISDKEMTIRVERAKLEELSRELSQVAGLNITSNFLASGNLGSLLFDQEKIDQLTRCYADLDLIEVNIQAVQATQKALNEQMDLHAQLISIGLDYLSIQPSNICPLCTNPHPSAVTLLDKVKSQNLLSDLSQENSDKLSVYSTRQKELRDNIQAITEQAVEAQVQQLGSLRKKQNEVEVRLNRAGLEKSGLEAEQKAREIRIDELEKKVWRLAKDELVTRVNAELFQLSSKRSNLIERQSDFNSQISLLNISIKDINSELQSLTYEMEGKCRAHAYVKVREYLDENAIASTELNRYCEKNKTEIDAELEKCRYLGESIIVELNSLQQEMQGNGTWVDFAQLKRKKEDLEVSLSRSKMVVKNFYDSLSGIIIAHPEDTLDKVKALIMAAVRDCQIRAKELNELLNRFKLLLDLLCSFKPYIKRTSLQKELTEIEQQLEQRNRVDTALMAEMDSVVSILEALINNFFYEDLINSIYRKIDPHPAFKKVEFKADFDSDKPGLNIVVSDGDGRQISPILYFSAAQTNILSLSVFLASALHAKDDEGKPIDVVMIDDPIQSMDSINILSTIDLLRSICLQFDKQIIISTHDENFFGLLQRKIPTQVFGSKFLQLEKFGVAVPVEPLLN